MEDNEVSEYLELIDELQKAKVGNSNELREWKQKLTEDKELDKAYLDYLTELDVRLEKKRHRKDRPMVTTTEAIQGKTVDEYMGIVSGHAVMGMGFFTDVIGGIRDVMGGRSESLESHFFNARELALDEMTEEAIKLGANAILAVRFNDVSMEGKGRQMALVSVHGTAVKIS